MTVRSPLSPVAYDCVKVIVVRTGSVILCSEHRDLPVSEGDVYILGAHVLCGAEPEGSVTVSTIYIDTDYLIDQFFWQYGGHLPDQPATRGLVEKICAEPAHLLKIGEKKARRLGPWLDELVALSIEGAYMDRFHRMQALFLLIMDVISPSIQIAPVLAAVSPRLPVRSIAPRSREFVPLRSDVQKVRDAMRASLARRWTMRDLAGIAHLSSRQLSRVFVDAYGKTPLAYLTMLRVEAMARLLREEGMSVAEVGRRVGWQSRNRATTAFREHTGVTPSWYRRMGFRQSPAQHADIRALRTDLSEN